MKGFADRVVAWQRSAGRHHLPWQQSRDPYRVWLAEIMLQQTRVATVLAYYRRFIERFPEIGSLASADVDEVMKLWSGLGYYARARNLHACARAVVAAGGFPRSARELKGLPGVGRSTAGAIAAFCWNERVPILDGNVRRVLARHLGVEGYPGEAAVARRLWEQAEALLPQADAMPSYTQGLMDLGATVCTRSAPNCTACPVNADCAALRAGRVHELPVAKPRRTVPLKITHMLIILKGERALLQRRPPTGIWGGLLAPPQFATLSELNAALRAIAPDSMARRMPTRRHAFTHFTLRFTPHAARVERTIPAAMEPAMEWLVRQDVETAALPAPIKVLLRDLLAPA
jgi:A/G-specific adenine glycosylase